MYTLPLKGRLRINRPFNQNLVAASLLFCLPGIYVAVTGLGAGGGRPSSLEVANTNNAIVYAVFAAGSLCVGPVLNVLKPRVCLLLAAATYPLYVGGLWHYDSTGQTWFIYTTGAISGMSAAFLWTACAFIQFCYPEEDKKGLYIGIQWMIKSIGATVGSFIAFGVNFNSITAQGVSNGVFAAYVAIQACAVLIVFFFVVDPKNIIRDDGTHLAVFRRPPLLSELKDMAKIMGNTRYLILIVPMFCCEMALGLMSSINARSFNLRTRALNNVLFNVIQFMVPPLLTFVLDNSRSMSSRRHRGLLGIGIMGTIAIGTAGGLIGWLRVNDIDGSSRARSWDWSGAQYPGLAIIYILMGSIYSGYQMVTEWTLAATTNDPETLARIAAIFKFWSASGMLVSFVLAAQHVPFLDQTIIQLVLYAAGIPCIIYVLVKYVADTNYFTETSVIAPKLVKEIAIQDGKATAEAIEQENEKELLASGIRDVGAVADHDVVVDGAGSTKERMSGETPTQRLGV